MKVGDLVKLPGCSCHAPRGLIIEIALGTSGMWTARVLVKGHQRWQNVKDLEMLSEGR